MSRRLPETALPNPSVKESAALLRTMQAAMALAQMQGRPVDEMLKARAQALESSLTRIVRASTGVVALAA
ncbi:hypothetical protein [Amantichitinum ursilacus]|uniref:Uncharacterized protein n=1 Tax=Amantichitinum ursilacus TaxID=857265 RepID=A0A0N0GM33_9NEIS|nr:hypothetical protein [Amantichitinum ursilacus]KPC50529.1 hypothetical protein WG78_17030 [Amantichitinum ursilacus]